MKRRQQKAEHTDGKAFSMIVHMKGARASYQIEVVAPPEEILSKREIAQVWGLHVGCW